MRMPLPPILQKRAQALQRQILSASLLQELESFLRKKGAQKCDARRLSFSDEEIILSFDQKENMRLEEKFRLDDLLHLEEMFTNHNLQAVEVVEAEDTAEARTFPLKRHKPKAIPRRVGNMTLKEFQNVLSNIFESESWDDNMELLCYKVDTSCDGFIDWSEFCTYLLLQYKEQDYMTTRKITFLREPVMRLCTRNKQEPTCRILAVSCPPPLWFMSISKGGVLTVWDSNLHPQKSYEITVDPLESQSGKRRFKSWATDAVYLPNVHKIAVATTSRDIHFFDVFTMNIFEEYHLYGRIEEPV